MTETRKRARTSEGDSQPVPNEIQKHPNLWFEDGNVVIVSKDTSFKVYRGVLSRNSDVFRDMFDLAQPSTTGDVEGCPIVHMSDSSEDLAHLLSALYERKCFRSGDDTPLHVLVSILRLANKYCLDSLRDEAYSSLKSHFPDTLELWQSTDAFRRARLQETPRIIVSIVNLALELELDIVDQALNICCQLELHELFGGYVRSDGTVERLSYETMQIVVERRDNLGHLSRMFASSLQEGKHWDAGPDWCAGCMRGCAKKKLPLLSRVTCHGPLRSARELYDPLTCFAGEVKAISNSEVICPLCRKHFLARDEHLRRQLWAALCKNPAFRLRK